MATTSLVRDTFDALVIVAPHECELSYDEVYTNLAEEKDLERPAAKDIVERLSIRGPLYEVGGCSGSRIISYSLLTHRVSL